MNSAPRVVGRRLLLGDVTGGSFFALDRFTGAEEWRVSVAAGHPGPRRAPIERDGIVYPGSDAGIYAVRLETGEIVWERVSDTFIGVSDIAFCGDVLLVQNFAIQSLGLESGDVEEIALPHGSDALATSGFAVAGERALVVGTDGVYGLRCAV